MQGGVPFDLTGDKTIGNAAHASTAVPLDGGTQEAKLAHGREHVVVEFWIDGGFRA